MLCINHNKHAAGREIVAHRTADGSVPVWRRTDPSFGPSVRRLLVRQHEAVEKSNKKLCYCCDSRSYCMHSMQYFNAIHCIATSRPLNNCTVIRHWPPQNPPRSTSFISDVRKIHAEKLWSVSVRVRNVLSKIRSLSVRGSNNCCGSASASGCIRSPHTSTASRCAECHWLQNKPCLFDRHVSLSPETHLRRFPLRFCNAFCG